MREFLKGIVSAALTAALAVLAAKECWRGFAPRSAPLWFGPEGESFPVRFLFGLRRDFMESLITSWPMGIAMGLLVAIVPIVGVAFLMGSAEAKPVTIAVARSGLWLLVGVLYLYIATEGFPSAGSRWLLIAPFAALLTERWIHKCLWGLIQFLSITRLGPAEKQ